MNEKTQGFTPSRRTLVKGAAWSVPVVAAAGAAPAFAASQWVRTDPGTACKLPGNSCNPYRKGYLVSARVCTNVRGTVTFTFGVASGTLCGEARTWQVNPNPVTIEGAATPGEVRCATLYVGLTQQQNSANCAISGTVPYTWTSSNGFSGTGEVTFSAAATPPCATCPDGGQVDPEPGPGSEEQPAADVKVDIAPAAPETSPAEQAPAAPETSPAEQAPPAETGTTENATSTEAPPAAGGDSSNG